MVKISESVQECQLKISISRIIIIHLLSGLQMVFVFSNALLLVHVVNPVLALHQVIVLFTHHTSYAEAAW